MKLLSFQNIVYKVSKMFFSDLSDTMPNCIISKYGIAQMKNWQSIPEKNYSKSTGKSFLVLKRWKILTTATTLFRKS